MIRNTIYGHYDEDHPAEIDFVDGLNASLERHEDTTWYGFIHEAGVSYRFYLKYDAELGRIILQRLQEHDGQGNPVDVEE